MDIYPWMGQGGVGGWVAEGDQSPPPPPLICIADGQSEALVPRQQPEGKACALCPLPPTPARARGCPRTPPLFGSALPPTPSLPNAATAATPPSAQVSGPLKIIFPSSNPNATYPFSILGLGDIVVPALTTSLCLRVDKALQVEGVSPTAGQEGQGRTSAQAHMSNAS